MTRPPLIVLVFAAAQILWIALYVTVYSQRDGGFVFPIWPTITSVLFVWLIWGRSRLGWCIVLGLTVLSLPFAYHYIRAGSWGMALFAAEVASFGLLVSPWMIRWVWKVPQPRPIDFGCDYCASEENRYYEHVERIAFDDVRGVLLHRCPKCGAYYEQTPSGENTRRLDEEEARRLFADRP